MTRKQAKEPAARKVVKMPGQHARAHLGALELLVILAINKLDKDAYGAKIAEVISENTQLEAHIGAVYTSLCRLESKKLIRSTVGESQPKRGGRAKRYYGITAKGKVLMSKSVIGIKKLAA